jgi:acyl dehydratase
MATASFAYVRALIPKRGGGPIPELTDSLGPLPTDPDRLRRYRRLCGYGADGAGTGDESEVLPLLYPHLTAFPLSLRLMARRDFPYPLPGLVHLVNQAERLRPIGVREPLAYRIRFGTAAPHRKGVTFPVYAEATADGEVVWRSVSTYLRRGADGPGDEAAEPVPDPAPVPEPPALSRDWQAPANTGRAYGSVSGDRNPIHLYPLTARLFGFRRAIAHGMWTKARALAALEQGSGAALPDAVRVRVVFRSPVLLPTGLRLTAGRTDRGWAFAVRGTGDTGRTHLRGELTPPED